MIDSNTYYDCIIVGGGIAGLQAALQLGRYSAHRVLVIDAGVGRSTLCQNYGNLLGFPDGVSGEELRDIGRQQSEPLGIEFHGDRILEAQKKDDHFLLKGAEGESYRARTLLLATGLIDRFPRLPGLRETLGFSVYVCPDCDGYEIEGRRTVVMGSGEAGAQMALILTPRTDQLLYINHEGKPFKPETMQRLQEHGIEYIEAAVQSVSHGSGGMLESVQLENGQSIAAERGFIAFGGNHVNSELAEQLGVETLHNHHIETNPRSKMTNIENVWVAGDLAAHSEQANIAMGEGAQAAIWIHKTLSKLKSPAVVRSGK
ncbi:NAD(P)/FAD-dependent oxidoreductase [Paenibacillus hunanensis]|uniref:NAD(P)/FAD-dependent oxidoreductase n=1 Tax=Paenibacillus hunanensis TaxID=539262 RepID=UPI002A6B82EB|nr:NAD(P)/FAD-dependent oxidoreductase [Paenibacillus hunanensis]WPP39402.1 NAD(P)/FAD-dependent oxidoreductase [Paenibacillus hunanensis]